MFGQNLRIEDSLDFFVTKSRKHNLGNLIVKLTWILVFIKCNGHAFPGSNHFIKLSRSLLFKY